MGFFCLCFIFVLFLHDEEALIGGVGGWFMQVRVLLGTDFPDPFVIMSKASGR